MEKSSIAGHTGGGGNEPQGREGFWSKLSFSKLKFSVSDKNNLKNKVGWAFSPTLKYCWGFYPNLQKAISYASRKVAFTLAEVFSLYYPSPRKIAFTLAEVLITLGIIGVVAAMTLPTLIAKYQEKVTVTKVKKAYSVILNAYNLALMNDGTPDTWGIEGTYVDEDTGTTLVSQEGSAKMARIFMKYLNKAELCEGNLDCIGGYTYKVMNGDNYTTSATGGTSVILSDGTGVNFTPWANECSSTVACGSITIYTDLKNTTQYGVNAFAFYLYSDRIVPWGASSVPESSANSFAKKCVYNGGNFENGAACTGWILEVGNMEYLRCSGLSFTGKHKCK